LLAEEAQRGTVAATGLYTSTGVHSLLMSV
jgi:hypothetical protein